MYTKTKFLLISFCFVSMLSFCQNTFVPDDNFEQALIDLGFDTAPLDDNVLTSNISGIKDLEIPGRNITDLTGIEDFISLTNLDCSNNQLSALNIAQNTNLIELYCSTNQVTNLDVTNQPNLVRLWCFSNQLANLNVTQNPGLISLRCEDNVLTALDASNNLNLNVLVCEQNQITTINISNSLGLNRFQCGNNALTSLDVSANSNLSYLSCEQNQITSLNLLNNNKLDFLYCSNNQLCSLNIKNGNNNAITSINFDSNPDLNCVVVDNSNGNHSAWEPTSFLNYVNSPEDCSDFVLVDTLENVIATSYTLPTLNNGDYFTETGGIGNPLSAGDVITTSQNIYIYNETACNSNESSFIIFINNEDYFIPKFFTPNNDGSNDVWQVYDRLNLVNNISIYNRHGKLLKFLPSSASSWDGTFNGELLSSGSYWYEIVLNTREILRGYFALKR